MYRAVNAAQIGEIFTTNTKHLYIKQFQCPNKRKCLDNISSCVFIFFDSFHDNKVMNLLYLAVVDFPDFGFLSVV